MLPHTGDVLVLPDDRNIRCHVFLAADGRIYAHLQETPVTGFFLLKSSQFVRMLFPFTA